MRIKRALVGALPAIAFLMAWGQVSAKEAPGARAVKAVAEIESASCPKFGGTPFKGLLADPKKAKALGRLNWRAAKFARDKYLDITVKDIGSVLTPGEQSEADKAVMSMATALSGWTWGLWSVSQTLQPTYAPSSSDDHPLAEQVQSLSDMDTLIEQVIADQTGAAFLLPVREKFHSCLVSLQNTVVRQNRSGIEGALQGAGGSQSARASVVNQYAIPSASFSSELVPAPKDIQGLFSGLLPRSDYLGAEALDARRKQRRKRRLLVAGLSSEPDTPVVEPPKLEPAPQVVIKDPKPSPAAPAPTVTNAERIRITDQYISAVWRGAQSEAQSYLHPNVTYRGPRNSRANGPSGVARKMIAGFRQYRPKLSKPRSSGSKATSVGVSVRGNRGTMRITFSGKKIIKISG